MKAHRTTMILIALGAFLSEGVVLAGPRMRSYTFQTGENNSPAAPPKSKATRVRKVKGSSPRKRWPKERAWNRVATRIR